MRDEFMISRQGKQFVLFAGLLDEFHEQFKENTRTIDTTLIQAPAESNGWTAIVGASVAAYDADELVLRCQGIGDASPENVGRNIAPHTIRMAETRAKARALRDAINVGATAFEELGGDENESENSQAPRRSQSQNKRQSGYENQRGAAKNAKGGPNKSSGEATEAQIRRLQSLSADIYGSWEAYEEDFLEKPFSEHTTSEANTLIHALDKEHKEMQEAE